MNHTSIVLISELYIFSEIDTHTCNVLEDDNQIIPAFPVPLCHSLCFSSRLTEAEYAASSPNIIPLQRVNMIFRLKLDYTYIHIAIIDYVAIWKKTRWTRFKQRNILGIISPRGFQRVQQSNGSGWCLDGAVRWSLGCDEVYSYPPRRSVQPDVTSRRMGRWRSVTWKNRGKLPPERKRKDHLPTIN